MEERNGKWVRIDSEREDEDEGNKKVRVGRF